MSKYFFKFYVSINDSPVQEIKVEDGLYNLAAIEATKRFAFPQKENEEVLVTIWQPSLSEKFDKYKYVVKDGKAFYKK